MKTCLCLQTTVYRAYCVLKQRGGHSELFDVCQHKLQRVLRMMFVNDDSRRIEEVKQNGLFCQIAVFALISTLRSATLELRQFDRLLTQEWRMSSISRTCRPHNTCILLKRPVDWPAAYTVKGRELQQSESWLITLDTENRATVLLNK